MLRERALPLLERAREVRAAAAAAGIDSAGLERSALSGAAARRFPTARRCCGTAAGSTRFDGPAVAIVGARSASVAGVEIADRLAADLAARGVTVVSGLARGVDGAAHRGAVRSGRTIAVMASGADRVYPPEHEALAREIAGARRW